MTNNTIKPLIIDNKYPELFTYNNFNPTLYSPTSPYQIMFA